jgi:hypothetical protein
MARKKVDGVSGAGDDVLRRLVKMPETAHQIYELAESLFMLDGDGAERRMTLAEIERVNDYLRQTDQDLKWMQKQFQDLAAVEGDFKTNVIPVGF